MITYEEFKKIDLRTAKVLVAERVEGSDKLVKLDVSIGAEVPISPEQGSGVKSSILDLPAESADSGKIGTRQIIAGIGKSYAPEDLIGKSIVIIANLEPRKLMGLESQGMLLAADDNGLPVILVPIREVPPGSMIK